MRSWFVYTPFLPGAWHEVEIYTKDKICDIMVTMTRSRYCFVFERPEADFS